MNWKITYLGNDGNLLVTHYSGFLQGIIYYSLPNSISGMYGDTVILKIEKIEGGL